MLNCDNWSTGHLYNTNKDKNDVNLLNSCHVQLKIFYIYTLLVCVSVRLFPINAKTPDPIGPKICVGPHMTLGKGLEWSNFQKIASNEYNFENLKNPRIFFIKSAKFFCFYFTVFTKRKCSKLKKKISAKRLKSLLFIEMWKTSI